jgi:sugar O-acyltransferase (sialic acid O-acetyltransferase NeuD family)
MDNAHRLILIGGGGHCKSCIEVVESTGRWEIAGILDTTSRTDETLLGYPFLGKDDRIGELQEAGYSFLIAIGQIKSPTVRKGLFEKLQAQGAPLPTIISPHARVSRHALLGPGTVVFHYSTVNAGATVGENCIINTASHIEHDVWIGPHTHISTGALINGNVRIGQGCFVGSGSILSNGVTVVDDVVIGAGSLVLGSISHRGTYVGVHKKI